MTIRITRQISRDLVKNSGWPIFHGIGVDKPPISATTITWNGEWFDLDNIRKNVNLGLAHRIFELSKNLNLCVVLFLVHRTLQPKSSIVMKKKIWKSVGMDWVPSGECPAEIMVECGDRVRFAAITSIPESNIFRSLLRRPDFDISVPVLLPNELMMDSSEMALGWTKLAFPPDGCREYSDFDWPIFATAIAASGGICVRETSDSVGTVAVDFFAADQMGDQIEKILSSDDELSLERRRRGL